MDPIAQAVRQSGRRHRELAENIGLSQPRFSDRMNGRTRWTLAEALALAGELRLPLDDLLIGPETPEGGAA